MLSYFRELFFYVYLIIYFLLYFLNTQSLFLFFYFIEYL